MRITTSRFTAWYTCLASLAMAISHAARVNGDTTLVVVEQMACPLDAQLTVNDTVVRQWSFSVCCGTVTNESIFCRNCNDDDNARIPSTAAATAAAAFYRVATWYRESLEARPVITKSATAALIGACGDVLAQMIEARRTQHGVSFQWSGLQVRRMLAIAAEGLFISGPLMHLSYEALEEYFPIFADDGSSSDDSWFMVILQVLVDAILMDSLFVATVILSGALLEGRGDGIAKVMRAAYIPAVRASWKTSLVWSPIQLLSFKYVPLHFRVVAVNLQDIAWSTTISCMAHMGHQNHQHDAREKEA